MTGNAILNPTSREDETCRRGGAVKGKSEGEEEEEKTVIEKHKTGKQRPTRPEETKDDVARQRPRRAWPGRWTTVGVQEPRLLYLSSSWEDVP